MKLNLRLLALSLLACTAIGSMAQAPQSGTYKIKSGGVPTYKSKVSTMPSPMPPKARLLRLV